MAMANVIPELWAKEIVGLLKDEKRRKGMAYKGSQWVKENIRWEIFARKMSDIFESVR